MYNCMMPTKTGRLCRRLARYLYVEEYDGREVVRQALCRQHVLGGGHAQLLRLRAWEFDFRVDTVTGEVVR